MRPDAVFGVVAAMDNELAQLRAALTRSEEVRACGLTFFCGTLGRRRAVLVKSGVGKVNAARCTQLLIDRFAPDCLINTGVAGGVGEGLRVADVVIGTELVQHDFNVSCFGYAPGNLCDRSAPDEPTVFRSDETLIAAFRRAAAALLAPERIRAGRIVSGDRFIAAPAEKRALAETFGALAAEMEGAAVAQTAAAAGVPFIVLRAVSDLADGSAPERYDAFENEAAALSAGITERLIRDF